jgi:hypothetical protein
LGDNLAADVASGTNDKDWGHRNYPTVPGNAAQLNNGSRGRNIFTGFRAWPKTCPPVRMVKILIAL